MFSLASLPHRWSAFFCFILNCADCDLAPGLSLSFSSDQNPASSDLHMAHFLTSFIFIPQSNLQCSWSTLYRTIFSPCIIQPPVMSCPQNILIPHVPSTYLSTTGFRPTLHRITKPMEASTSFLSLLDLQCLKQYFATNISHV